MISIDKLKSEDQQNASGHIRVLRIQDITLSCSFGMWTLYVLTIFTVMPRSIQMPSQNILSTETPRRKSFIKISFKNIRIVENDTIKWEPQTVKDITCFCSSRMRTLYVVSSTVTDAATRRCIQISSQNIFGHLSAKILRPERVKISISRLLLRIRQFESYTRGTWAEVSPIPVVRQNR